MSNTEKPVAVIGSGLVGSLEALFLANLGFHVELYKPRQDIRLSLFWTRGGSCQRQRSDVRKVLHNLAILLSTLIFTKANATYLDVWVALDLLNSDKL